MNGCGQLVSSEHELRDAISRCNHVGVKTYADVVIHHTCASNAEEDRLSSRGSYFTASREEFPSVPYSSTDFNDDKCTGGSRNIKNYQGIYQPLALLLDSTLDKKNALGLMDLDMAGLQVMYTRKLVWPKRLHNLDTMWF
ncbi:alpha-amylase 1-like [Tachysurus ichikawai]